MRSDPIPVIREWEHARCRHPFFAEGLSEKDIDKIWDDSAETYGDGTLSEIHDMITEFLVSEGYVSRNKDLLDIGCGPGTYSLRLSPSVKGILAIDKSARMLERLDGICGTEGITNIRTECADWDVYVPKRKYDIAFSSLCPPVNSSVSILKMEMCSSDTCIYISSMSKDRDSIYFEIWRELGREYTYEGYDTGFPLRFLKSIGREPILKKFEIETCSESEPGRLAEFYKRKFLLYRDEREILKAIEDVVGSHAEEGVVRTEQMNRLGLLIWRPSQ